MVSAASSMFRAGSQSVECVHQTRGCSVPRWNVTYSRSPEADRTAEGSGAAVRLEQVVQRQRPPAGGRQVPLGINAGAVELEVDDSPIAGLAEPAQDVGDGDSPIAGHGPGRKAPVSEDVVAHLHQADQGRRRSYKHVAGL